MEKGICFLSIVAGVTGHQRTNCGCWLPIVADRASRGSFLKILGPARGVWVRETRPRHQFPEQIRESWVSRGAVGLRCANHSIAGHSSAKQQAKSRDERLSPGPNSS